MDLLSMLREYAIRGELDRVILVGGELRCGSEYSFPSSAVTAYRSKQGGFYTLDALLFSARHHHLKHTDYLPSWLPLPPPPDASLITGSSNGFTKQLNKEHLASDRHMNVVADSSCFFNVSDQCVPTKLAAAETSMVKPEAER
ncbi:PHP [Canna indica]|uniref:PHP n=1 Tax=Canna indica TaxID=4628 RepID=A0AAQ3JM50_9LILI|nr:PHP [Canna indica]